MISRIKRILRYYRKQGKNKKQICEMLGVHISTLNKFLNSDYIKTGANPDTILRLETQVDKLIEGMKS